MKLKFYFIVFFAGAYAPEYYYEINGWWDLASYKESRGDARVVDNKGRTIYVNGFKIKVELPIASSVPFSCPEMNELYNNPDICCACCSKRKRCETCDDNGNLTCFDALCSVYFPCALIAIVLQTPCYLWNCIRNCTIENLKEDRKSVLKNHTDSCEVCSVKSKEYQEWWDTKERPRIEGIFEKKEAEKSRACAAARENTRLLEAQRDADIRDRYAKRLEASKGYDPNGCTISEGDTHKLKYGHTLYIGWYNCPNCKVRMTDSSGRPI